MSYLLTLVDSQKAIENAMNNLEMLNALIQGREQLYKSNHQPLTRWLVKGSLLLNEYGGVAFFTPFEKFKDFAFPDVVEMQKIKINVDGWTHSGGSIHSLPKEGSICPYCGKEVTLQDVYLQNFHVENPGNSFAYHAGDCHTFHCIFEDSFAAAKRMILIAKRAFGEIENVCVQEGNHKQDELVKISFMAVNHKIEILIKKYGSGLAITYDNNTEQSDIYKTSFYPDPVVEEKLKEWKNTL